MRTTRSVIPKGDREEWAADPFYSTCALVGHHGHGCGGKITWEHAIIFGGSKVQARWAVVPLCEKAHAVNSYQDAGTMRKEVNEWVALSRATLSDILALSGETEVGPLSKVATILQRKAYLTAKYGTWAPMVPPPGSPRAPAPGERKFWVPLDPEQRELLQVAIDWHRKNEGVLYSPFEMVRMAIREYAPDLENKLSGGISKPYSGVS